MKVRSGTVSKRIMLSIPLALLAPTAKYAGICATLYKVDYVGIIDDKRQNSLKIKDNFMYSKHCTCKTAVKSKATLPRAPVVL